MDVSEFHIGLEFWCSGNLYRCTDVGSRVVVAIRIDEVTIATHSDGVTTERIMGRQEAEQMGWFNGPPYGVLEMVFDEYDLEGCLLEPE
ncbi:MAG: hypothetical protein R3D69_17710 [Xanthobacteraceae bacterium]